MAKRCLSGLVFSVGQLDLDLREAVSFRQGLDRTTKLLYMTFRWDQSYPKFLAIFKCWYLVHRCINLQSVFMYFIKQMTSIIIQNGLRRALYLRSYDMLNPWTMKICSEPDLKCSSIVDMVLHFCTLFSDHINQFLWNWNFTSRVNAKGYKVYTIL